MNNKVYAKDIHISKSIIKSTFMIIRKLYKDGKKDIIILGDSSGDFKASIVANTSLELGMVLKVKGKYTSIFEVSEYEIEKNPDLDIFLPKYNGDISNLLDEIEKISLEEFKSKDVLTLNEFFFKDQEFLDMFKSGIGGVSQHHNYRGGLAEHTLGVMKLTKHLAYSYRIRRKEIAILGAKLHDIGKIYEFYHDSPFRYSLRGEMEGHIVIGTQMVEKAFNEQPTLYTEEFKARIKACIVQHHGKLEYGSPREPRTEEALILSIADNIDATMNKVQQIRDITPEGSWSEYDKRINSKLFL